MTAAGAQQLKYMRFWLGGGWLLVLVAMVMSVLPGLPTFTVLYSDKIFHAITYFVLMIWFSGIYLPSRYWSIALALALLGVALEFFQTLFPYRFFDSWDIAANMTGVAIAWLVAVKGMGNWCQLIERRITRSGSNTGS
ncbi:MAG: VanZ family protein [Gammaproteobacteria bacterium]|nr:VanZ family protein [Gammaproteobacteria bacterium]